ncbi:GNAT family N-acetyltransferase [Leptothoe spongobia]|uniref:GNAT family N-acetyltransferase n=1 Tax=Leptothoe spongobia TAU-MAC 1115 TaxID=1967444 RepID=A0A947DFQ6_9CYAN|nr:GNAT family N-acetyltransferase [Leptothoe spongobia]MBT9316208.1 GNAT family N-acetyltransferase [Leptothoe spongobia TAU-MAC 1115]
MITMFRQLETERLQLTKFQECDIDGYTLLLTDSSTHPFIVENGPIDPNVVASRIRRIRIVSESGSTLYWTIWLKSFGEYVGYVALHATNTALPVLSYAVVPNSRRQGFASEAIRAVVEFAIGDLQKNTVLARVHLNNHASCALLEANDFNRIGTIDWYSSKRLEFSLKGTTGSADIQQVERKRIEQE